MAYRIREELVGKRFLSVKSDKKHKVGKIFDWEWRPGFVRAVSTRDTSNADLTVLVEFDDTGWKSREYIKVHEVFLEFLVEHTLSWVERKGHDYTTQESQWPALCFKPIVDKVGLFRHSKRPVEFLDDRNLSIVDEHDIVFYREGDENNLRSTGDCSDVVKLVKAWTDYQDGQKILLTTPTVLLGYRVEVYRTEGTTQWYTAVIKSYNHANKSLTLTDDTVLEEHNEDPALIQMHLIGDGVVDSILNGVDVGVAQRRRPRSTVTKQNSKHSSSIIGIGRGSLGYQSGCGGIAANQIKLCNSNNNTSTSIDSVINTGSTKLRTITTVDSAHSLELSTPEPAVIKGQNLQKSQKRSAKRKPDPATKAAKKTYVSKKIKRPISEENLDARNSPVCKHTCNVVVKRIEEEPSNNIIQCKEVQETKLINSGEELTKNIKSFDKKTDGNSELSVCESNLINCLKDSRESIFCENICDSKDKLKCIEVELINCKEKVRIKENKEAANLCTEQGDIKTLSPGDTEASENELDQDIKSRSGSSIKQPCITNTTGLANTINNVIINLLTAESGSNQNNKSNSSSHRVLNNENTNKAIQTKKVNNDLINDKIENIFTVGKTQQKSTRNKVIKVHNSDQRSEEDMNYKKQIYLRALCNTNSPQNTQKPSISEGIDVIHSVTEQVAIRNCNDKYTHNGEGKYRPEVVDTTDTISSSSSLSSNPSTELERSDSNSLSKLHDFSGDRHSAFTCVQSSSSRSCSATPAALDRADSRASDSQLPIHLPDDKLYGSRFDDICSVRSSPGTSPLVSDRLEVVNPYRDPELMRKNPVQSSVQNILAAQHKMNQSTFPSVHAPIPGVPASSSQSPAAFSGAPALQVRSLLSTLPYTNAHHLSSSISHHLALPHGYPIDEVVRAQQLVALQQQHLMGYTLGSAPAMAAIEALWQGKFPTTPIPTPYMLQKNPDALLSSDLATALHREHIQHQIDAERREHERIEVERRERLEHELREKERKEMIERERHEKEKAERNKIEREKLERERLEKDRAERERKEWELKHSQERILDTEAAVDQHFAESLTRLASQQGINMFPSIARATGRGLISKSEAHHISTHGLSYHEKEHFEHRAEDQVKREVDLQLEDKRYIKSECEKNMYAGHPYPPGNYHPSSGLPQQGQKSFFLYGYPSSHSTITQEQLKQRGLNHESRQIKEEIIDKKHSYTSVPPNAVSPVHLNQLYSSKDIKRESHNSVIVKIDSKPPLKTENPVAAHSHHNSPSSSSPRPQQPRPAHTPEHHRPDRSLSSSTSPASNQHLHHSSPTPAGSNHLPPSHSNAFHSTDPQLPARSQSPYKTAASQSQSQALNFSKISAPTKMKALEQQQLPPVHSGYPSSLGQVPVSVPNSVAYSYSLIQQGLVPNPIYSHMGPSHPTGLPPQHSHMPHSVGGPLSNSLLDTKSAQLSPLGNKRKTGSKEMNACNRKKPKGHTEVSVTNHPMSIPETTPQVIVNSSPYTTTSSSSNSSTLSKCGLSSGASLSSSPSLTSSSHSHISSGFLDSFKSFVENTVQIAFLQDEKKAQEKAERDKQIVNMSLPVNIKNETNSQERKPDIQLDAGGSQLTTSPAPNQDVPEPTAIVDSYSSRIMDTINRVANNHVDTDSDTLSAPSPPPQIKPSDTNSPLSSQSGNSSYSRLPHHMKKAWLQRHDKDKKSETPVPTQGDEDSNSSLSHNTDTISCVENSSAPPADCNQESRDSSPANVVVTLPNGNISDLNHHHDESTSSASESEMQSSSKTSGPKKRVKLSKPGAGSTKKVKSDSDKESSSVASTNSSCNFKNSQNKINNKQNKAEKESKSKDDSQTGKKEEKLYASSKKTNSNNNNNNIQPSKTQERNNKMFVLASSSPQSERSNPSPALSEGNISQASSTSSNSNSLTSNSKSINKENKHKKKSQNKEQSENIKKNSSFNKPLVKMTVSILKKTMMPFIQDGPCSEITPKLNKCRECKMTPVQLSKKQPNIFCRFYAFRRLKYNSRGIVTIHGFSELSDADPDDIEPWLPRFPVEEPELDVENSKFIIAKVGDKFCELVQQEKEAKSWAGDDVNIVWKRAVQGVREMCDVCDTTLFNMHWVCSKCGFVVCLDCYEVRMKENKKALSDDKWLTCSCNKQAHKASEMMLTQIIPSDALWELGRLIHDIRIKWSIPSSCPCGGNNVENSIISKNGINQQLLNSASNRKFPNGYGTNENGSKQPKHRKHQDSNPLTSLDAYNPDTTSSPLSILAEVASMEPDSSRSKTDAKRKGDKSLVPNDELLEESDKKSGCSTLRELLTKTAGKPKGSNDKRGKKGSGLSTLDNIIQSVVEKSCTDGGAPFKFLHYTPRLGGWKRELPIMVHSLTETSVLYPDIPHSWLCDGRLLRLQDAHHKGNLQIFQEQWKRGQPVVVSCANKKMNINIWKPEVFSREFGHIENEVVNCRTGDVIIGHTMGEFWDGFENLGYRPTDDNDEPMLLKLKDWPPGDDFSELLPSRFQDLMNALPLPEYTQRKGKLNLASRLPDFLVRPDLGPKMYNAYGSSQFPKEGTTNLHLDISDAVNVMVYVGVPGDGPGGRKAQEEAAVKAIDDAGCDSITKRRVREVHEIPGALWHIYDAHDADKIRDFLNKVAKERGEIIEKDHDAIHDQSWYLDKELCDRLLKEYGVQGYTIVQCLGDAIFIPAGAPHQVRNLHSCVKVAEDFVSPEHLNHCFRLTQEFRQLSETHSNHEDKLQVKNIIYHAVKDAIAVLREHDPEDE